MEKLINKIEEYGWTIKQEDDNLYRLGNHSPSGQYFSILVRKYTDESFIDEIYQQYNDFDVSTETYQRLDKEGHGMNGELYEMADVLADMEQCKENILDLYKHLKGIN